MTLLDQRYIKALDNIFLKHMGDIELEENFKRYLIQAEGSVCGEIYTKDSAVVQVIDGDDDDVVITNFTDNGLTLNCISDAANNKITLIKIRKYLVVASVAASIDVGTVTELFISAYLNGIIQPNIHANRALISNAGNGSISLSGLIDVTEVGMDLELRANISDTSARDIIFHDLNLSVVQI